MKFSFPKIVFFACLLIFSFESTAQNQVHDSLKHALELHKQNDTIRVTLLLDLGMKIWNDNHIKGKSLVQEGIDLSVKLNWKKGEVLGLLNRSSLMSRDNLLDEAMEDALNALKINEKIKDRQMMASIYSRLAITNNAIGDRNSAEAYALKNLELSKELKDEKRILNSMSVLAEIYGGMQDWETTQKYLDEGLRLAIAQNDKYYLGRILMTMSDKEQYFKNYKEAKRYLLQNLSIQKEINDHGGVAYIESQLSLMLANLNEKDSAYYYANDALQITRQFNLKEQPPDLYYALYYTAYMFQDYKNALRNHLIYDSLRAENYNMETGRKLEMTKNRFQQEKKDIRQRNQRYINLAGALGFLLIVAGLWSRLSYIRRTTAIIKQEKERSESLLLNILPVEIANELKAKGSADAKMYDEVTVMFTDFKGFTQISEKLTPTELVAEIDTCFNAFDNIISRYDIEKIKTIGDSYMCAGGLPVANKSHAEDIVNFALEIQKYMAGHLQQQKSEGKEPFLLRIGIHTGPVVAGIVGVKKFSYDIWGDTVNIASRMQSSGEAGKINISFSTYELVKEKFSCTFRGKIEAKNKGMIDMYFLESKT